MYDLCHVYGDLFAYMIRVSGCTIGMMLCMYVHGYNVCGSVIHIVTCACIHEYAAAGGKCVYATWQGVLVLIAATLCPFATLFVLTNIIRNFVIVTSVELMKDRQGIRKVCGMFAYVCM